MKRLDYLADSDVARFVEWASHLVRGDRGLKHAWYSRGYQFQCSTLYEALERYHWNGDNSTSTMRKFDNFRHTFDEIGVITNVADRSKFIDNAWAIAKSLS